VKKSIVLHIISDDKFFDGLYSVFEELINFQNIYLLYTKEKNFTFKYIKNTKVVTIVKNMKELYRFFSKEDVKIIYFHSFTNRQYFWIRHIEKAKILVWWSWGYDLYSNFYSVEPLINIDLYKEITYKYISDKRHYTYSPMKQWLLNKIFYPHLKMVRDDTILRFNYCATVLPIEYELLTKHSYFKAKYISPPCGYRRETLRIVENCGNILLGNSATPTNNHLDVLNMINKYHFKSRKIILPLSYGDNDYRNYLEDHIRVEINSITLLTDFLPFEEYSIILNSCTHAIFGHLRQQAIGNIYICLRKGMKVFLYKDSMAYKQLKDRDKYVIYSIDDDFEELFSPIRQEDAIFNYNKSYSVISSENDAISKINTIFNNIYKESNL
jgi:dTDP-N-acetylfucosamine:lipid II N-acetylfucosaminyltransferase